MTMPCQSRIAEWTAVIRSHLPMLSQPQATVLALWSLGMVLYRSCALTTVAVFLADWCHRKEQTVRQQLREFGYEVEAKRGPPPSPRLGHIFSSRLALPLKILVLSAAESWSSF